MTRNTLKKGGERLHPLYLKNIYLPCAFEGVYILNVSNLLKTFLDKNILRKLHVYNTQNHFNY
jgi:hypothetical protein